MAVELIPLRLISFSFLWLVSRALPGPDYIEVYICVLFGHYLLQIVYSAKAMPSLSRNAFVSQPWAAIVLNCSALLALFCVAQNTPYLPIAVYFGIHFILTELYTPELRQDSRLLHLLRFLMSLATYSLFVRNDPPFAALAPKYYVFLFCGSSLGAFFYLAHQRKMARYYQLLIYEGIGFCFAWMFSTDRRLALPNIIFYHLIWWALYPLKNQYKDLKIKSVANYLAISTAITGVFFLFRSLQPEFFNRHILLQSSFYGNIHITLSFLLSSSHPKFINRFFGKTA